jgi:pyruvate dehydrogenase E1 component beta subunit
VKAEVLDLRTLSPLDTEAVVASVAKTGRCVVIHEAPRTCGLGAELSALVMERCLLDLRAPVERVAGFDTVMPFPKGEHFYLPDVRRIVRGVRKVLNF